ncbi:hypothetical protein EWM64_g8223, partial [Hericium alpestre]
MPTFSIAEAHIVALFLQSIFYGIFLITFAQSLLVLRRSRRTFRQRRCSFIIALLFFIFGTLDIAFLLRQVVDAFIYYTGPGGANVRFEDISDWGNAMRTVFYCIETSLADGLLIYRCWIVYGRRWTIVAGLSPLWIACTVCEVIASYTEFTLNQRASLSAKELQPFITTALTTTLALNLIATSMIAWRIRSIRSFGESADAINHAVRVIVESGAMYSISVLVFFIVYLAGSNGLYAASDCAFQIIGIAFNLIIIRVERGQTAEATSTMFSSQGDLGRGTLPFHFR